MKSLSKRWQEKILDNREYEKMKHEDETLRIVTFAYSKTRRLIVSHSNKRAEKDRQDREKAVNRLYEKLEKSKKPESLVSNYGYRKFLSVEGEVQVTVDEAKMAKAALWDGLHGVLTNIKDEAMSAEEVLSQYHGLWQVEESFRISKHDLCVRPIFHWSADRIKAHLAICFVAFSLIRFLQHRILKEKQERYSADRIRQELFRVQESIVRYTTTGDRYVIPSKPSNEAYIIYEAMQMKRHIVPFKLEAKG